jgi:hypothetical protein
MKLYQILTEKQMDAFLKKIGTSLAKEPLTEILNAEEDLFGDFIIVKGYKFKKVYSEYSCMETPTEKHKKIKKHWAKAPGDYYKK